MKKSTKFLSFLAIAGVSLIHAASAQESTTTTITSDGTMQQIVPTSSQIMVTTSTSTTPVKYTYTKSTTFVDGAGNTVTQESIKPNTPARIYYMKQGDSFVVTKYVMNPTATTTETTTSPATTTETTTVPVTTVTTPATTVDETTTETTTTKK